MNNPFNLPKFIFAPDQDAAQLYIVSTEPFALIWIEQYTPAKLSVVKGENDLQMLEDATQWYKSYAASNMDNN